MCVCTIHRVLFVWNFAGNDRLETAMSLFIQSYLPQAVLVENLSSELIYQLPDDAASVSKFEQMFVDLDSRKSELGISSYGISNTSLEEVWLADVLRITHSCGIRCCDEKS